jgi:hypothetical protein
VTESLDPAALLNFVSCRYQQRAMQLLDFGRIFVDDEEEDDDDNDDHE